MNKIKKVFADHGLLIVLTLLFVVFLVAQTFSGLWAYNGTRAAQGLSDLGYWQYVTTGNFLDGVFANWQAALLQLGALILFGIFLRQRGAAHSIKPGKRRRRQKLAKKWGNSPAAKLLARLYANSLSLAFLLLFLVCFVLHLFAGNAANNEQRALLHQPPLSAGGFFLSSQFWFLTMQTWEAEFMAIALYVALTIFLRQEGSPESKPVDATNDTTGVTNE